MRSLLSYNVMFNVCIIELYDKFEYSDNEGDSSTKFEYSDNEGDSSTKFTSAGDISIKFTSEDDVFYE
jgi:hypothetical protein